MIKGLLLGGGPIPRESFLGEVNEGAGDGRVIGNEPSIKIGEA